MNRFLKFISLCFTFLLLLIISLYFNSEEVIANSYPFNGLIYADALVMRSEASNSSSKVTEIVYGSRVNVTGESGKFYKVTYDGKAGYILKSYVLNVEANKKTNNISGADTYEGYCNSLVAGGFDRSYCPYLYYLHSKYPNWKFTANRVGVNFNDATSNEKWKVVLQSSNSNYWLSSSPAEADYYYINQNTIGSFMDPRNSLFENTIFQFLDFQTSKGIYNDAALNKIATVGDGYLKSYSNYFAEAGVTYSVNPLHLISRSSQETGGKSSFKGYSGTYSTDTGIYYESNTLDGYYNFYNINSYSANGLTALGNGLAYAAGYVNKSTEPDGTLSYLRPWDTQEKAIKGGAKFIAEAYTNKGQNTNYFEKFNVSTYSAYTKYTHQYMTNAYAPAGEAIKLYNAYNAGNLLNSSFNFIIPVYENMGNDAFQAINRSNDAKLSNITVDGKTITGFQKDVVEYNYNIQTNNNYVDVAATSNDGRGTINGTGRLYFNNGVATATINVTAEDGVTKSTYIVNIKQVAQNKVAVADIVSKLAVKVNGSNMYDISPGTQIGTLVNTVVNNGGKATVKNSNGTVKSSGSLVTGDVIVIEGATTATYTISVKGDINGDGEVKLQDFVLVQSHILGKSALTGVRFYAADINNDNAINLKDFVLIQSHILGKSSL